MYQQFSQQQLLIHYILNIVLFIKRRMSASSTPRGTSLQNIPFINPNEYFSAEKIESSIPTLVIKKIGEIVDQYFKLKPLLVKKQNEIKGLYTYNQKMIETMQTFMEHQKKVVKKYNKLCQIYVKNFKEYLNSKNIDVNFKDIINPITSMSDNFSMNDWKVEIQENKPISINENYQEMLLKIIKKYYLNHDKKLEEFLQKQLNRLSNQPQLQHLEYIKSEIRQLNTTIPNTENMFDLLSKRKTIQQLIKELDQNYISQFTNKDMHFIDEVQHIHSIISNPTQKTFKDYLDREAHIRRSLMKKGRKFRQSLQLQFQRIQNENIELKQQIQEVLKKNSKIQTQRNQYRTKFQYLQMRVNANSSVKKDKNTSNNTSMMDEGIRQTNKKLEIKVNELQKETNQLKQQLKVKEQLVRHEQVKRQLNNSNSQIQNLRLKLTSKLVELGIENTQTMTSGQMFDTIMDQMKIKKYSQNRDKNQQNIQIKVTGSLVMPQIKPNPNVESPIKFTQSIIQKQSDELAKAVISAALNKEKLQETSKEANRETMANQIRATGQDFLLYPTNSQSLKFQSKSGQNQQLVISDKKTVKALNPVYNQPLLSISQRKSVDEQSKYQDASSKIYKDRSVFMGKGQQNIKNDELSNIIRKLQQQNNTLAEQKRSYLEKIQHLQELLNEKRLKPVSVFQSIEKEVKKLDAGHAGHIQKLCQSIVRQLHNLQGSQFMNMMANVQEVINRFKSSSSNQNNIQIPVLSQELNLFRSQNIMYQILGAKREDSNKPKSSYFDEKSNKSIKLSLNSGLLTLKIKHQKSIFFGKEGQPQQNQQILMPRVIQQKVKPNEPEKVDSSIHMNQEQFLDSIRDFQQTSRKKKGINNISQNSLKFSQSNLRILQAQNQISKQSQIRSSLRLADKIDKKILQDAQLINKLQLKLQQIKNYDQCGKDLYWFYMKYKQAMEALESAQAKIREYEKKKEACMTKLIEQDANLSKSKLQQKIYFLQQKIKQQQQRQVLIKEKYEETLANNLKEIDQMRQSALNQLVKGIFSQNYPIF